MFPIRVQLSASVTDYDSHLGFQARPYCCNYTRPVGVFPADDCMFQQPKALDFINVPSMTCLFNRAVDFRAGCPVNGYPISSCFFPAPPDIKLLFGETSF